MLLSLVFAVFAVASADVFYDGPCPEVELAKNFDLPALQGTWYEIARFSYSGEKDDNAKCTVAEYFIEGDKATVKNSRIVDGVKSYIEGDVSLVRPGELLYTYKLKDNTKKPYLIKVLNTDSKNYVITYNCQYFQDTNKHQVISWIKARSKTMEGAVKETMEKYLKTSNIVEGSKFVYNDHSEEACKATETKPITDFS